MKLIDFAKAFGLGALVLALNLAALVLLVFLYGQFVAPGRPPEHYSAVAPQFGAWSAPIVGITLLFATAWVFGRRRPPRNAYAFALAIWGSYFVIDTAMGLAMGPPSALFMPPFLIGMGGGLAASLAGAALAARRAAQRGASQLR